MAPRAEPGPALEELQTQLCEDQALSERSSVCSHAQRNLTVTEQRNLTVTAQRNLTVMEQRNLTVTAQRKPPPHGNYDPSSSSLSGCSRKAALTNFFTEN